MQSVASWAANHASSVDPLVGGAFYRSRPQKVEFKKKSFVHQAVFSTAELVHSQSSAKHYNLSSLDASARVARMLAGALTTHDVRQPGLYYLRSRTDLFGKHMSVLRRLCQHRFIFISRFEEFFVIFLGHACDQAIRENTHRKHQIVVSCGVTQGKK